MPPLLVQLPPLLSLLLLVYYLRLSCPLGLYLFKQRFQGVQLILHFLKLNSELILLLCLFLHFCIVELDGLLEGFLGGCFFDTKSGLLLGVFIFEFLESVFEGADFRV